MKSRKEIEEVLKKLLRGKICNKPGTYEWVLYITLVWVLNDDPIDDLYLGPYYDYEKDCVRK